MKSSLRKLILIVLASSISVAGAAVKMPALFSNGMVLQRDMAVPIWGTADPGEKVTVEIAGQTEATEASADGAWMVRLKPMLANEKSQEMVVSSPTSKVALTDVLVGDVYLASGQSNMGSPMSSGSSAQEAATANDPLLRFFNVTKVTAAEPQKDLKGKWEPTSPATTKNFSAVAYYYAKEIRETQKVPVGVIHGSWGGTPIQSWMSLESIKREPPITKTLEEWDTAYQKHLEAKDKPELMQAYLADLKDWETNVGPALKAAISAHNEAMAVAKAAGQPTVPGPKPSRPEPIQPDPMAMPAPSKRPGTPAVSYNGMIAPVAPYGLKAVLWYQGEQNGSTGVLYRTLFNRLIEGWRTSWGNPDLPFLYVQLPACYVDPTPVAKSGWPVTREAQFMALQLPHTGMAVTLDIGDPKNVHPDNKIFTGHRLALVGRKMLYHEDIVASGPLYKDFAVEGNKVRIRFTEVNGGLTPGEAPWVAAGNTKLPSDHLVGFYIAGADKKWEPAEATIDGDSVVVSSAKVSDPVAVRYGWANSPQANLYNKEGLPASPFRTDTEAAE